MKHWQEQKQAKQAKKAHYKLRSQKKKANKRMWSV